MKLVAPRLLAMALCASMAVALAPAQAAPESGPIIKTLVQGIPHAAFFGLSFEGNKGVAVGAGGTIFESSDSGQTWKPVQHGLTELALLAVDRRAGRTVAVGQFGLVMVEEAPGKWSKIDTDSKSRMYSVGLSPSGMAVAVGEFGTVRKSADGGKTWGSIAPDWSALADPEAPGTGEPSLFSVQVSETNEITIAGEFGVMMRSVDAGLSWQVLRPVTPKAATIFAMHLVPQGQGNSFAVGQTGELLVSGDGGTTWAACSSQTKLNFLGVAAASGGQVVITGMRVMMRSLNGGMTWDPVVEGDTTTDWYQAVRAAPDSGQIMAVGHAGRIIRIGG
ncbi:MAG: WD40/YVTN/BNR-like repeat-containing protein [Panacagrimonas sp.]